jgi:hypothetical protein
MFRDTEERCFYKVIKVHPAALRKLLYCSYSTTQNQQSSLVLFQYFNNILYCCNHKSKPVEEKNTSDQINVVPLSSVLYGDNDIFC